MNKFLLVATAAASITLLAAPAFADRPADHGGSNHDSLGTGGGESGNDGGSESDPEHFDHDGNSKDRVTNRRTTTIGGTTDGKKK